MSNFDDIFESAPQTDEFDKEAWAAKKKAERDEVYALADATAEAVCADGGKFRDYLDVQAAFRNYSATNALLILATKPDARRLGDKDFWRDQGVYIKRQEFSRPIKIVESNGEYTRDDGSIGVSYNIKRVYDISQTTARTRAPQAVSHDARALLNALIYKRPAPVQSVDELPNGMDAVYDREQNAVFVRRGLSANDLFCGLSKALAQAELARTGEEYTEENAGFKAQCVSYILGKEFGVDVTGYAFEAPADFLRTDDPQTIRTELTDIYQNFNLFQHLTVLENAAYPLYVRKMPKKKADELAAEKLLQVGLKEDQFKRFPNMLSGGEQQRVAIARALTSGSELILADEPTGNLDSENSRNIVGILQGLAHEGNRCVIIVTHDPAVAEVADVLLKMKDGKLIH